MQISSLIRPLISPFRPEPKFIPGWTHVGQGFHLDFPDRIQSLMIEDEARKGHMMVMGTTRVGKTRLMEHMIEQDIRKGHSVLVLDPKGDGSLLSKIIQVAIQTDRFQDVMLFTPIFPQHSVVLDPLSHHFMMEELVAHLTCGIKEGKDPFFLNTAYETSLFVTQALLLLAEQEQDDARKRFNIEDVKNNIGHSQIKHLRQRIEYLDSAAANRLKADLDSLIEMTPEYYTKVGSTLRVNLNELSQGNIGQILGRADENRLIERLENGQGVILVAHLGSLLAKRAAFTAGKVLLSMIQSFVGRIFHSGREIFPRLCVHMDECQNVLFSGIEDLYAKAGGAGVWLHGYCQSIGQLQAELGPDRCKSILDNCNSRIYMRCSDADTAFYVSEHLGEKKLFSPIIGMGTNNVSVRESLEPRVKHTEVLELNTQEFFMTSYSGKYRGKVAKVADPKLNVVFPDIKEEQARAKREGRMVA